MDVPPYFPDLDLTNLWPRSETELLRRARLVPADVLSQQETAGAQAPTPGTLAAAAGIRLVVGRAEETRDLPRRLAESPPALLFVALLGLPMLGRYAERTFIDGHLGDPIRHYHYPDIELLVHDCARALWIYQEILSRWRATGAQIAQDLLTAAAVQAAALDDPARPHVGRAQSRRAVRAHLLDEAAVQGQMARAIGDTPPVRECLRDVTCRLAQAFRDTQPQDKPLSAAVVHRAVAEILAAYGLETRGSATARAARIRKRLARLRPLSPRKPHKHP